jgi:DNA-binding GntR family transcriptional regulator
MPGPDVLTRSLLANQVKERLLESILDGSYPPDSRIVETAIAKELGTSQAPVREALRGLEAVGMVEITPFRGARVRRLDPAELLGAYIVRSTLEVLGTRLAVPRMTDEDVAELVAIGERLQAAARSDDRRAVAIIDASLHERIIELSGNRTLLRVWRSLEPLSRTYITLAGPGSDPQWSADLHNPILDAISRHDTEGAVQAIESHFEQVRVWLADHLVEATGSAQPSPPEVSPLVTGDR